MGDRLYSSRGLQFFDAKAERIILFYEVISLGAEVLNGNTFNVHACVLPHIYEGREYQWYDKRKKAERLLQISPRHTLGASSFLLAFLFSVTFQGVVSPASLSAALSRALRDRGFA